LDKALAQRLIGAIVLVMLGVLFLPMILNGAGELPAPATVSVDQPNDRFEYRTIQIDSTLQSLRQPPANVPPQAAQAQPAVPVSTNSASVAQAVRPAPAAVVPRSNKSSQPAQARSPAWAVQAGTFSVRRNALAQRDQLKSAGFQAYVLSVKHPKVGVLYRVRVGPAPDKRMAAILQQKVHLVTQLDTQLVAEQ